jgi:hypothetical protein
MFSHKVTMIFGFLLLALFAGLTAVFAVPVEYQGPVPPPSAGYGRWGDHAVAPPESFQITSQGYANNVTLYLPADLTAPASAPAIFFAPGWDVPCDAYAEFLRFFASKGYAAVCDDYGEDSGVIGAQLNDAFSEAVNRYQVIDTDKFGLVGHSSGAGLLPSLGYVLVHDKGWGSEGKFIFSAAPWIDFDMTDAMVAAYPTGMKLLIHTYEDDKSTDLRTYILPFESLPIPDSEKEYITLRSTAVDGYDYLANHAVVGSGGSGYGVYDALDHYGVFRLAEALADYAFNDSAAGKNVALGDGSDAQIEMGELRDLISTYDPLPIPGVTYDYPCDISDNPRREHCADYDGELPASVLVSPVKHISLSDDLPLFTWEPVTTTTHYYLQVRPLLPNGEPDGSVSYGVDNITPTAANCEAAAQNCVHLPSSALPDGRYVWWIRAGETGAWSRRGYFQVGLFNKQYLPILTTP